MRRSQPTLKICLLRLVCLNYFLLLNYYIFYHGHFSNKLLVVTAFEMMKVLNLFQDLV